MVFQTLARFVPTGAENPSKTLPSSVARPQTQRPGRKQNHQDIALTRAGGIWILGHAQETNPTHADRIVAKSPDDQHLALLSR